MSSNMSQGLQSSLESQIIEPLVLRLKLSPPKSTFSVSPVSINRVKNQSKDNNGKMKSSSDASESKNSTTGELGGWSFLKALTNTPQTPQNSPENNSGDEKVYVHPMAKRSSSMLSEKSLEMCTESLGSETGSEISESMDDSSFYLSDSADFSPKSRSKNVGTSWAATKKTSFPPPLTSISGSGRCVRVKSHREDGRLVIKTITVSSSQNFFHAERGNGRLRLHLLKESPKDSEIKSSDEQSQESIDDDDKEEEDVEDCEEKSNFETEDETEEDEEIESEYEEDDSVCWSEDMDEESESVDGKIEMGKFQNPNRCKESGFGKKDLWNLEAFWVSSTSS